MLDLLFKKAAIRSLLCLGFIFPQAPAYAQSVEGYDPPTGAYILCVENSIVDGAILWRVSKNEFAKIDSLVTASIKVCAKKRLAAIKSISKASRVNSSAETSKYIDGILGPHFIDVAKKINAQISRYGTDL